jgi:citrate synthase
MAEIPKLVSSMSKAELDRIFVRGYDLNADVMGKISFAQMVYLILVGRIPTADQGRMIDTMLIVLVDHGMTTGALAARMTYHSAPEALQGAVAAAILGAGSVHLGSSEYCAKMLNDALPLDSKETDLDAIAQNTVAKRLASKELIPGIGHGIHTQGDPRAEKLFEVAQQTQVYRRYCDYCERSDCRRTGRPPAPCERDRRHRGHLDGYGIALADVQVLRDSRPRARRHRACRRRGPTTHRPRHFQFSPVQSAVRTGEIVKRSF